VKYGRALLADVEGYVPGEQPDRSDVIKLNTNENPYPPSPEVSKALASLDAARLRRYPDPVSKALRDACARRYGLDGADWVIAGNGMDEILALTVRTFADPGDTLLTTYPTYSLYDTLARLHGCTLSAIDLDTDWQLPPAFFETPARLVFLPRPNAPTGICARRADVERLCRAVDGIVFIDEAYVDFAEESCVDLPRRFDNVVIGRTFSKSFSLAGMRIGLGIANPDLIAEFLKTKDSYNMNLASQAAGLAAIRDYEHMLANVARVKQTRARMRHELLELGFEVPPSEANFVLAFQKGTPSARVLFERLRERGIYVRYFGARGLHDALRISVGTDDEADELLDALRSELG
jgi:histidinol-phosphate aminotransferase